MFKFTSHRSIRVIGAFLVVMAAFAISSTEGLVPVAKAENRCGTWAAGVFINNSGRWVLVKGNKAGSDYTFSVNVGPGKKASDYGICDADFYKPTVNYIVQVSTSIIYTYNAYDAWTKIGTGTFYCSTTTILQYKDNYPISCSPGTRYPP